MREVLLEDEEAGKLLLHLADEEAGLPVAVRDLPIPVLLAS